MVTCFVHCRFLHPETGKARVGGDFSFFALLVAKKKLFACRKEDMRLLLCFRCEKNEKKRGTRIKLREETCQHQGASLLSPLRRAWNYRSCPPPRLAPSTTVPPRAPSTESTTLFFFLYLTTPTKTTHTHDGDCKPYSRHHCRPSPPILFSYGWVNECSHRPCRWCRTVRRSESPPTRTCRSPTVPPGAASHGRRDKAEMGERWEGSPSSPKIIRHVSK